MSKLRILKEYEDNTKNPPFNCSAGYIDDFKIWDATIIGPSDSPYTGGIFKLSIKFGDEYPFKPPTIKFITPVLHPNIDKFGNICLDILNVNWSPILSISKLLLSISSLLNDPNPNDPLDKETANLFIKNIDLYNKKVRLFTLNNAC